MAAVTDTADQSRTMRWLQWGKQSSIFGFPIALVLIIVAFWNISYISHMWVTLDTGRYLYFLGLGRLSRPTLSFARVYLLWRIAVSVTWGVVTLLNVVLFRRAVRMAYTTLALGAFAYIYEAVGYLYAIYIFTAGADPEGFIEFRPVFEQRSGHAIPWPARFYFYLALYFVTLWIGVVIVLDAHYSYAKIVEVKGTGWERKAYYEIYQAEGETVATLQEHWEARMGIRPPQTPTSGSLRPLSPAPKDGQSARETSPLVDPV